MKISPWVRWPILSVVVIVGVFGVYTAYQSTHQLPLAVRTKPVIEFELPTSGATFGSPDAEIVMVEFGSFDCITCKLFTEGPLVRKIEPHIDAGRIRFRYVDILRTRSSFQKAALLHCRSKRLSIKTAFTGLFRAGRQTDTVSTRDRFPDSSCAERLLASGRLEEEADIATRLGVLGTPTFVIGKEVDRRVVGWVLVGARSPSIFLKLFDAAEERSEELRDRV